MDAVLERARRFRRWSPENSFGFRALLDRGLVTPRALAIARVAESLYPTGLAGQSILDSGTDPIHADAVLGAATASADLPGTPISEERAVLWWTENMGAPRPGRLRIDAEENWAGKPRGALYTSDGASDFPGAWPIYVSVTGTGVEGWSCWRLTPQPHRTYVVDSALSWCRFADRWLAPTGRVDWKAAAAEFDAVQVSLSAVLATDCFEFSWQGRLLPAPFWGTETTVWLRWVFTATEKVEALPH